MELRATVSPSEDAQKVLAAMRAVFGDCEYSVDEGEASIRIRSGSSRCLQRLHDQLRDRHVRDAARRLMLASLEGRVLPLKLNRQAAAAGVLALCSSAVESPLGPLNLEIETDAPEKLIDWLTDH
ncbi:MAG TPA: RNA-binding domain-containing protein [Nitrososphaerales archaeon]|nr:RNA-binding domain-containing protein [Nitrososphaerales archaeon]